MKPIEFKGWEGDKMSLGTLEGGSAPILIIKSSSFCFNSPEQVQEFISALEPFGEKK